MKLITGSILILLVMVQTFTAWLIVTEYVINKDYIAKNLCINRAKPKLRCNGKCQLMKKLAEEEQQNPSGSTTAGKIKMSEVLFSHQPEEIEINGLPRETTVFNSGFILKRSAGSSNAVFHPPCS